MINKKPSEEVLKFWFGDIRQDDDFDKQKQAMWFLKGADYDDTIQRNYGKLYQQAAAGQLIQWEETARGRMALIILLDQFSRHLYRGKKQAFAQDEKAQQLVLEGIERGHDKMLPFVYRSFFYMPLEHAENLELQEMAIDCFSQLLDEVPASQKARYQRSLDFAKGHHYVIEKFGRFPELNAILGRQSTDAEKAFLAKPGYKFL